MSRGKIKSEGSGEKKNRRKAPIGKILLLLLLTAAVFAFYRYMLRTPYFPYVLVAYMVIFAVLLIGYVVYNRGFSRAGITEEMLPMSMSASEKREFVEDAKKRKEASKWVLLLIFPFVFTFGAEALGWFITDNILSLFKDLK